MLGKALLVVTGVSYGVAKALDTFSPPAKPKQKREGIGPEPINDRVAHIPVEPRSSQAPDPMPENRDTPDSTHLHLDRLEKKLNRIEQSLESLAALARTSTAGPPTAEFVTRAELAAALEQFAGTLDAGIERRFDVQNRSVQSLRTMITRTDELLEQVLEGIDATNVPASRSR